MTIEFKFFTPQKTVRRQFNIKGSKFIATFTPAESEDEARKVIDAVSGEFPEATHHTYAYRIGAGSNLIERASDAREPAGTAGPPMLQVMQGKNISNAIVVATRYFGGTKLGIGGLTRAYRDCALLSIEDAKLVCREPLETCILKFNYENYGAVSRLIQSNEGNILSVKYAADVTINMTLPSRMIESFKKDFESACRGRGEFSII